MEYSEKFNDVLNDGESVIKAYKPNKLKYWVSKGLAILVWTIILALFALSISHQSAGDDADPDKTVFSPTTFAIAISIVAVIVILVVVYYIFYYRNLYYAVTNKRVLIRRGVFGTDYKSLDMQMLGAIDVHVTLLDKLVRHNTGSIMFGSNSAPITAYGATFMFKDIMAPYNESKDIKTAVDDFKNKPHSKSSEEENK